MFHCRLVSMKGCFRTTCRRHGIMTLLTTTTRTTNTTRNYLFLSSIVSSSSSSSSILPFYLKQKQNWTQQPIVIFKRSLFIQTATTPNPESLKFLPGRPVYSPTTTTTTTTSTPPTTSSQGESSSSSSTITTTNATSPSSSSEDTLTNNNNNTNDLTRGYYATKSDKKEIAHSPLMQQLFKIEGIKSIYLGSDFITITKYAESHWSHLRTPIYSTIMDFYSLNIPTVDFNTTTSTITDTTILESDSEVVAMIKEILETRIRPAVQEDGGDIRYVNFNESTGIVYVKLAGSCVGCPSSSVTLKNGVENMLIHYIPEVLGVHAVDEEEEEKEEEEKKKNNSACHVTSTTTATTTTTTTTTTATPGSEGISKENKMKSYEEKLAAAGIPFSD